MNTSPTKSLTSNSRSENTGQSIGIAGKENQLTLEILQAIEQKDNISQRHLAQEMGVALGLANSYLKRCVKKGWIKMTTAPANRYLYYLTPNGFAEKARLTAEFFSTSLALFKQSGDEYTQLFETCLIEQKNRVLLVGLSDLTEIALMRSMQSQLNIVGIYQPRASRDEFFGVPVFANLKDCGRLMTDFDVAVLSSMEQTIDFTNELGNFFGQDNVKIPTFLMSMNYRTPTDT